MSEFTKYKPPETSESDLTQRKSTEAFTRDRDPIEIGSERGWGDQKSFVEVDIKPKERQRYAGRYVIKEFGSKDYAIEELTKVVELDNCGVPIPNTHRLCFDEISEKYAILYTDLSENGKNKVWSGSNTYEELQDIEITQEEFNALEKRIQQISKLASKARYILNFDAYFLVRKESGELDVVIADFGIGIYRSSLDGATRSNKRYVEETLREIKKGVKVKS